MHTIAHHLNTIQLHTARPCRNKLFPRQPVIWSRSGGVKAAAGCMLDPFSANHSDYSTVRQSGNCRSFVQGQQAGLLQPLVTNGVGATAAGAVAIDHSAAPDAHPKASYTSWRTLRQCMLLAAAALGAAPALLLLDIAEQAVLGMGRIREHVSRWHSEQQQHYQGDQPHAQQQEQQQQQSKQQRQAVQINHHVRPLLPLWPPLVPMVLAVAPLGLLVLLPMYRPAFAKPALLLGASLVVQAYLNLVLTVWARVRGTPTTAAPPAWAGTAAAATAAAQQAAPGAAVLPAKGALFGEAAVRVFVWLQVAGDLMRLACSWCIAWSAVCAVASAPAGQAVPTSILWAALQQCLHAADLSHAIAAATIAAANLQHLLQAWWQPLCIGAVCCGTATVYSCSLFARCRSGT